MITLQAMGDKRKKQSTLQSLVIQYIIADHSEFYARQKHRALGLRYLARDSIEKKNVAV